MNHRVNSLHRLLAMDNKLAAEFADAPKTLPELNKLIIGWASDRGILTGSTPADQFKKTAEEFGELVTAIALNDHAEIADAIGDIYVTLVIGAEIKGIKDKYISIESWSPEGSLDRLLGHISQFKNSDKFYYYRLSVIQLMRYSKTRAVDFEACVNLAWDQIKDRKGKLIDGMFVKESDL